MSAVRANVSQGNKQISLATEDLFTDVVNTPGVEQHILNHCPSRGGPAADSEDVRLGNRIARMAKMIMPCKGVPFSREDWPSVVLQGLTVLNRNNWFPAMTLMIGNPGETDEDVMATLDLLNEVESCGLFALFVPSIFTPLHNTKMANRTGVAETKQLTPLQWQLMMKCWKRNLRPGQNAN